MKKTLLIVLIILTLSGCGKKKETINCSLTTTEGIKLTTVVNIKIKDDIVTDATATMTYEDEETANNMCKIFNVASDAGNKVECKGDTIVIKDYHKTLSDKDLTKEEMIDYHTSRNYTCK